jgi:hypothetical protein
MRSKAWLAARMSLWLARLRSTRVAAPVLLAHANVTKIITFFQFVQNLGTQRYKYLLMYLSVLFKATFLNLLCFQLHDSRNAGVLVVGALGRNPPSRR